MLLCDLDSKQRLEHLGVCLNHFSLQEHHFWFEVSTGQLARNRITTLLSTGEATTPGRPESCSNGIIHILDSIKLCKSSPRGLSIYFSYSRSRRPMSAIPVTVSIFVYNTVISNLKSYPVDRKKVVHNHEHPPLQEVEIECVFDVNLFQWLLVIFDVLLTSLSCLYLRAVGRFL